MSAPTAAAAASASAAAFAATQVDELFILVLLFGRRSACDVVAGYALATAVVLGLGASGAAAGAAPPAADRWLRLLGVVPLCLGLATLARRARRRCLRSSASTHAAAPPQEEALLAAASEQGAAAGDEEEAEATAQAPPPPPPAPLRTLCGLSASSLRLCRPAVAEVTLVVLAAGGEEVAVLLPLFAAAARAPASVAATAAVYAGLAAAWPLLALALARTPPAAAAFECAGEAAEPWLCIAVGLYCLVGSPVLPVAAPWLA
jgi:cadmium resistance protein CadD (predicted permease)